MARAQKSKLASEIVFIDSTGHIDNTLSAITIISTNTKAGAVPLCAILTKCQAFKLFKENYPDAFGGQAVSRFFLPIKNTSNKTISMKLCKIFTLCSVGS
jgi:hypothetical protein